MAESSEVRRPRRAELAQYYQDGSGGEDGHVITAKAAGERDQRGHDAASVAEEDGLDPRQHQHRMKQRRDDPVAGPGGGGIGGGDPLDINGSSFDAEAFSQKVIKEASLKQLITQEAEVVKEIGALDSDMQTLVYENYNKFIAATDTIKKMRVDFRAMEDEMDQLADKMHNINVFSSQITETLRERRKRIGELSGTHALLKKLQFLFELPAKLKECMANEDLSQGVRYYLRAQRVLDQYEHMPSFKGIKSDCDAIMLELKEKLFTRLRDPETAPEDLTVYVHLLLQLQEGPEELCDTYLATARVKLQGSLDVLKQQVDLVSDGGKSQVATERPSDAFVTPMDILEFVDHGCNTYISDLCLVIGSYTATFLPSSSSKPTQEKSPSKLSIDQTMAAEKLVAFVKDLNGTFFETLRARLRQEKKTEDTLLRVRALDRFHRRIQAMNRLLPGVDFSREGLDLVLEAAQMQCKLCLDQLKEALEETLVRARQKLVAPKKLGATDSDGDLDLSEMNSAFLTSVCDNVRSQMSNLQLFIDPELTFAVKTYFRRSFSRVYVREGVLVAFFSHLIDTAQNFCQADVAERVTQPSLLLLLSRLCIDLQQGTTQRLVSLVDEQFFVDDGPVREVAGRRLTSVAEINEALREVSQLLLDQYVRSQGEVLSQMLRKSVETRDWLNTVEPRTVRAVMKRVVEETTTIDRQVAKLYEEGIRKARSSDSSRRTRPALGGHQSRLNRSNWSVANSQLDSSLASNIQKMFNERIEIFSSVESSRVSILTGIVKIALKTLLECVRLRTFSRFGFQQIQVDTQYLNLYLWRFVSDENLVSFMLDEVMNSVVHRCSDPVQMEASVIDVICDRG